MTEARDVPETVVNETFGAASLSPKTNGAPEPAEVAHLP